MANYLSSYTGPQIDTLLGVAEETEARIAGTEERSRYVVDGRVWSMINNGDGTITVKLSQGRVWKQANSGVAAYKINAITATLSMSQGIIVDLDGALDGNGRLTAVVGNVASSSYTGWQTGNKLLLFVHSFSSTGAQDDQIYGGGHYKVDAPPRDQSLMRVVQTTAVGGTTTTDAIKIFIPSKKTNSTRWTEWGFYHQISAGLNSNVWRLGDVWDVSLTEYTATRLQRVTTGGEFEIAVLQNGAADFVGGISHGNQVLTDFDIAIDGAIIDNTQNANYTCRRIEAWQKSELFQYGTTSTKIADVDTRWLIEKGVIDITTTITWSTAITLSRTHLGMLPLERSRASGANLDGASVQITGVGRREPTYRAEDISTSGYTDTLTTASRFVTTGTGGYGWDWRALDGWTDPARRAWFGASVSNKLYPDPIGAKTVAPGDVTTLRVAFEFSNPY